MNQPTPPPLTNQPWGAAPMPGPAYPGGPGAPATAAFPKAGFGRRLGAWLIDALLVVVLLLPGGMVMGSADTERDRCSPDSPGAELVFDGTSSYAVCERPAGGAVAVAVLLWIVGGAATLTYIGILEGKRGQTWGKRALGIRTVDLRMGQPIGPARAIGRYLARFLSSQPCGLCLGYFWMLWDNQRQTWHDKIVGTVVVKA